jgi:Tol biopolymer transport system component
MITDFSGRYESGNADNVLVHLADGTVTRLTANLDYDESVDMSPNGQWLAVGSSRTLDYLTPMSQIVRPTFVPAYVVFPTFQAKKGSLNQAWVVSTEDELNRENGIFLGDTSGAYNSVPVAN